MRRDNIRRLVLTLILGLLSSAGATAAPLPYPGGHGRVSLEVDVGLFYDNLAPHGQWVEYEDYGWVWVPRVAHGWCPYTLGHWVWTDEYGWLWVSDEEFGWAVFHYGRWLPDRRYGWVWVPGYEWAPAWVSWRSGGGYIGWAPLPPRVTWQVGAGFRVGSAQIDALIAPQHYVFVEERSFVDPALHRRILPPARIGAIISVTRNTTDYSAVGSRVVNRSLSLDQVQRVTGRAVPRMRAVEVDSLPATRQRVRGGEVPVFRPPVRPRADRTPPHGQALSQGDKPARPNAGRHEARVESGKRLPLDTQGERERRDAERRLAQQQKEQERQRRDLAKQREREGREAERRLAQQHAQDERQRRDLEKRQTRERETIERQHRAELKHPPRDVPSGEIERRQAEQHRALEERQHRERQQHEAAREQARQQREAQVAASKRTVEAQAEARKEGPRRAPEDHKKKEDKPKAQDRP